MRMAPIRPTTDGNVCVALFRVAGAQGAGRKDDGGRAKSTCSTPNHLPATLRCRRLQTKEAEANLLGDPSWSQSWGTGSGGAGPSTQALPLHSPRRVPSHRPPGAQTRVGTWAGGEVNASLLFVGEQALQVLNLSGTGGQGRCSMYPSCRGLRTGF